MCMSREAPPPLVNVIRGNDLSGTLDLYVPHSMTDELLCSRYGQRWLREFVRRSLVARSICW